ncbi:MAG: hypothetical protein Phog2KO_39870 [Phototrophicaceae bacterium]
MNKLRLLSIIVMGLLFSGLSLQAQSDPYMPRHADEWMDNPLRGAVVELSWLGGGEDYEPSAGYVPSTEDFEQLRDLGANVVVIYVQQTWTMEAPYEAIPEEIALLEQTLDNLGDILPAVIGIRNGPGRNEMMPNYDEVLLETNIYNSEEARDAYIEMLSDTVSRFDDYDSIIAWEPMVEPTPQDYFGTEFLYEDGDVIPPMPEGMAWWNDIAERSIEAIRDVDPDVTIVLEPIAFGGVPGFIGWEAFDDDNIVYSLHQYDPFEYTHQFQRDLEADPFIVYPYYSDIEYAEVNADWFEDYFEPVFTFQDSYNVPIFVGEWGIIRWVPNGEQFLSDQLAVFEDRGWSNAFYAWYDGVWDGSGFELQLGTDRQNYDEPDYENPVFAPVISNWSLNQN